MKALFILGTVRKNDYQYKTIFALKNVFEKMDIIYLKATYAYLPELDRLFDNKFYFGDIDWVRNEYFFSTDEREKLEEEIRDVENKTKLSFNRLLYSERGIHRGWTKYLYWKYPPKVERETLRHKDKVKMIMTHLYKFYKEIIDKTKPDVVILHGVIGAVNFIPAVYCKYKNIPFLQFYPSTITHNQVFFSNNIWGFNHLAQREYKELLSKGQKGDINSLLEYIHNLEDYYTNSPNSHCRNSRTESMKLHRLLRNIAAHYLRNVILNNFRKLIGSKKAIYWKNFYEKNMLLHCFSWYLYGLLCRYRLKKFKNYNETELRQMKYIYFPLHWEPECSLYVNAPEFANQLFAVDLISKFLPFNMKLFVRDHFANIGMRTSFFYSFLRNIPTVETINPYVSPFPFMKNSSLVITINGTSGWQALCFKKPVITLGNTFYDILGLTYKIKDINVIDKEILNVINTHKIDDETEYLNKLALYKELEGKYSFDRNTDNQEEITSLFVQALNSK